MIFLLKEKIIVIKAERFPRPASTLTNVLTSTLISTLPPVCTSGKSFCLCFGFQFLLHPQKLSFIHYLFTILPLYQILSITVQVESIFPYLKYGPFCSIPTLFSYLHTSSSFWATFLEIIFFITTILMFPSHLHFNPPQSGFCSHRYGNFSHLATHLPTFH